MELNEDTKNRIDAIKFCQTSEFAVTICIWPSASGEKNIQFVKNYLENHISCRILYENKLTLELHTAPLIMMAVYDSEEWLETNCWYMEQPLKEGKPSGAWPGAKWKAALCFQETNPLHVFVVDVSKAKKDIWNEKYSLRAALSERTGYYGNSCMHVSDNQSATIKKKKANSNNNANGISSSGYDCADSYAYHCSRIFLNPNVVTFLNQHCKDLDIDDKEFMKKFHFNEFLKWLKDDDFIDYDEENDQFAIPLDIINVQ